MTNLLFAEGNPAELRQPYSLEVSAVIMLDCRLFPATEGLKLAIQAELDRLYP